MSDAAIATPVMPVPRARVVPLRVLLVLPAALFSALALGVPMLGLIISSLTRDSAFSLANYSNIITDVYYWEIAFRTLKVSVVTTVASVLVGYPAALCLYFAAPRYKNIFLFLIVSPLFVSGVVRTYGWIVLLSPRGAVNALLPEGYSMNLLRTETAIVIGLLHIFIPFMILSINAAVVKIDKRLLSAAATLGASRWRQFVDILLPLSRSGIVSGCVLVFALSMTAFATPVLLGGTINKTLPYLVYQFSLHLGDPYMGSALALTLLTLTVAVVKLLNTLFDRQAEWETPR